MIQRDYIPLSKWGEGEVHYFRNEDLEKVFGPGEEIKTLDNLVKLTAESDPVLAELWDNKEDAAYNRM
jgi:hypothetical protein